MGELRTICNTSPIIGLMSIDRLSLLWQIFDEVMIPQAVFDELCADPIHHASEIHEIEKCIDEGKVKIYRVKTPELVKKLYGRLHYGELEVIVGAKELGMNLAVIDEQAARKMAAEFFIDTIGILGILLYAKKKGFIANLTEELDRLRLNGYRISDELYAEIIAKAKEN